MSSAALGAALACGLLLAACGGSDEAVQSASRDAPRHGLLIVVDTLRADHGLGAGGNVPGLTALAEGSVVFTRAIAPGSWTLPSMVALFTGHDAPGEPLRLPDGVTSLAESLQDAGWATGAFVCSALVAPEAGFDRGFDEFHPLSVYGSEGAVARWLEARGDGPTFTYVHLLEPHAPYGPPEFAHKSPRNARRYGDLTDDARLAAPAELGAHEAERLQAWADEVGEVLAPEDLETVRRGRAGYAVDVTAADRRITALVELVDAAAGEHGAVVVVTSDHGEGLWTRRAPRPAADAQVTRLDRVAQATHGSLVYPELVHVPLIVRAPGWAPARVDAAVGLSDIMPTLLALGGVPGPPGLTGLDLDGLRRAPERAARLKPATFASTRFADTVVSHDGWQLIVPTARGRRDHGLELELFDLNRDPEARQDLSAAHPERVAALRRALDARWAGAPGRPDEGHGDSAADAEIRRRLEALGYLDAGVTDR